MIFSITGRGCHRPKLDRNVFGGAIGGPVWHDRVFFFTAMRASAQPVATRFSRNVPLSNLGQGNIRFVNSDLQVATISCSQLATVFPLQTVVIQRRWRCLPVLPPVIRQTVLR